MSNMFTQKFPEAVNDKCQTVVGQKKTNCLLTDVAAQTRQTAGPLHSNIFGKTIATQGVDLVKRRDYVSIYVDGSYLIIII